MTIQRRRASTAGIIVLSLIAPAAAFLGARILDGERITGYWTAAVVSSSSPTVQVSEAIDYDFGQLNRRGILRSIPDLAPDADVRVSSATAPTQLQISGGRTPTLRIGDPNQTISGRHRYFIDYPLDTLRNADQFSWNAVGTEWQVAISSAEIHITSDREFSAIRCDKGRRGSFGGCDAEQVAPGHLVVETGRLAQGEGVTVSATLGDGLPGFPDAPKSPMPREFGAGTSVWLTMGVALAATLAASPIVGRLVRRRGREQIRHTTATTLGYIDDVEPLDSYRLADESEMARLIYPSLVPPQGISAPQGGILVSETVRPEHKVAWLLEAAALGEVDLEETGTTSLTLRRGDSRPRPASENRLDSIFSESNSIVLGKYDKRFASSWSGLETDLERWKDRSGFWDATGDRQRAAALLAGSLLAIIGAIAVALTSGIAMRWSPLWVPLLAVAALFLGSALTVVVRSWELRVRTPEGTSKWIEVEALRRFLSELEPESALNMIEPDRFAGYTAWAVAFGLDDKWKAIMDKLQTDPRFASVPAQHFHLAQIGPSVTRATRSASTAPSSSSGGGGGGVGGGGGGGGGGSW